MFFEKKFQVGGGGEATEERNICLKEVIAH